MNIFSCNILYFAILNPICRCVGESLVMFLPFMLLFSCVDVMATEAFSKAMEIQSSLIDREAYMKVVDKAGEKTLKEIKDHCLKLRMDDQKGTADERQLWYMAAISRPRDYFTPRDWETLAAIHSNYAEMLFYEKDNSVMAYPVLLQAIEIEKENCPVDFALCSAYVTMAHIHMNYGNTEKAIDALMEGLVRNQGSRSPGLAQYSFANLVLLAWEAGRLPSIKKELEQFSSTTGGMPLARYNSLMSQAALAKIKGDNEVASEYLAKALQANDSQSDRGRYAFETSLIIAANDIERGMPDEARRVMLSADTIKRKMDDFYLRSWRSELEESYWRSKGNIPMAQQTHDRHLRYRDSLYNTRNYSMIRDLEELHVTNSLNAELEKTTEEKRILAAESEAQRTILWIVGAFSLVVITLLLYLLHKQRLLNQCNSVLFDKSLEMISRTDDTSAEKNAQDSQTTEIPESADGNEDNQSNHLREVYDAVVAVITAEKEIFNPDFSIESMSRLTGIRSRTISHAVNSISGKSFSNLVAEARMAEACRLLLDPEKRKLLTIEGVAEAVGYKSRTYFSKTFKQTTGMTCTEFINQARKKGVATGKT